MSIHRSLVAKSRLRRRRSVLTRDERIKKLQEEGRWNEGDSIYGLPKVRVVFVERKSKKEKKKEKAEELAAQQEAEGASTADAAETEREA